MATQNYFPEQQNDALGGGGSTSSSSSGSSVLGSGGASVAPQAGKGTGFVNLQKYISTNKDTGALADTVSRQAGENIGNYQKSATEGAQNISNQANQATQTANQRQQELSNAWANVGSQLAAGDLNAISSYNQQRAAAGTPGRVDASGYLGQSRAQADQLRGAQDLARNNLQEQQRLLGQEFGSTYRPTFGALDSVILNQTNRSGLESGLDQNIGQINQIQTDTDAQVQSALADQQAANAALEQARGRSLSASDAQTLLAARQADPATNFDLAQVKAARDIADRNNWGDLSSFFEGSLGRYREALAAQQQTPTVLSPQPAVSTSAPATSWRDDLRALGSQLTAEGVQGGIRTPRTPGEFDPSTVGQDLGAIWASNR